MHLTKHFSPVGKTYLLTLLIYLGLAAVWLLAPVTVHADDPPPLPADPETCELCHQIEVQDWRSSPHAGATITIEEGSMQCAPGDPCTCLSCHSTNFSAATGTYDHTGVTCEACHGLLAEGHPEEQSMQLNVDSSVCSKCHAETFRDWRTTAHADGIGRSGRHSLYAGDRLAGTTPLEETLMTSPSPLNRRDFLKLAGCGAAAAALPAWPAVQPAVAETPNEKAWGMLIDVTRCTGCQSCALACKQANRRPNATTPPRALSSEAYTFVDTRTAPANGPIYVKRQCMQCAHPACVSACTVGALRKRGDGPVTYDSERCIGCRYCQYACPFGVPTYDWNNPLGLIHKCQLCVERLDAGELPACISSCPAGALRFGRRVDLLAQAHAQIRSNPGRYLDQVYGETEAGGTSVLYLAGVPFSELGLPTLGDAAIPLAAEGMMRKTPWIAATVASLASGLYWLTKRRELALSGLQVHSSLESDHDHPSSS